MVATLPSVGVVVPSLFCHRSCCQGSGGEQTLRSEKAIVGAWQARIIVPVLAQRQPSQFFDVECE